MNKGVSLISLAEDLELSNCNRKLPDHLKSVGKPSRTKKKPRKLDEQEEYDQENQPATANVLKAPKRGTPATEATKKPKKARQSLVTSFPASVGAHEAPKPTSSARPARKSAEQGRPAAAALPSQLVSSLPFEEVRLLTQITASCHLDASCLFS